MNKARLFVGSSSESLDFANSVQEILSHYYHVTVWSQGVFKPSRSSLESLIETLDASEFGIFIFSPEDIVKIREKVQSAVRDNVIFELGLFVGRLGRDRCFIITPQHAGDLHLPSDLIGMEPAKYDETHPNKTASLGPACTQIRRLIDVCLVAAKSAVSRVAPAEAEYTEGDILALIEAWWPKTEGMAPDDVKVEFAKVDRELSLPSGSTQKYINRVANRKSFKCVSSGNAVALFEYVLDTKIFGSFSA